VIAAGTAIGCQIKHDLLAGTAPVSSYAQENQHGDDRCKGGPSQEFRVLHGGQSAS
jgi:hypothetical protein